MHILFHCICVCVHVIYLTDTHIQHFNVPRSILLALLVLTQLIFKKKKTPDELCTFSVPSLQMRKINHKEAKRVFIAHPASKEKIKNQTLVACFQCSHNDILVLLKKCIYLQYNPEKKKKKKSTRQTKLRYRLPTSTLKILWQRKTRKD